MEQKSGAKERAKSGRFYLRCTDLVLHSIKKILNMQCKSDQLQIQFSAQPDMAENMFQVKQKKT